MLFRSVALGAVGVFLAIFFGYYFSNLFYGFNSNQLLSAAIALVLWLGISTLGPFFIKSANIGLLFAFLDTLVVWFWLQNKFSLFTLIAAAALFLALFFAFLKGRAEINDSLKIRFVRISRRILRSALTGIAFLAAFYLLGFLNFPKLTISDRAFEFFLKGAEPIIAQIIAGFSLEAPFDKTLENFIRSRSPQGTQEALIRGAVNDVRQNIIKATDTFISPIDKTTQVLYNISISKLLTLPRAFKILVFIAIGLLVFFLVKSAVFFLGWLIIVIALLAYEVLFAFNFGYLASENRTKEVIIVN